MLTSLTGVTVVIHSGWLKCWKCTTKLWSCYVQTLLDTQPILWEDMTQKASDTKGTENLWWQTRRINEANICKSISLYMAVCLDPTWKWRAATFDSYLNCEGQNWVRGGTEVRREHDETDEHEVVYRDRGKRTRSDERWMFRWISFLTAVKPRDTTGGETGGRWKRRWKIHESHAMRDVGKLMIKADSEEWRQTGTLMSQTPKIYQLYIPRSCLTLSPPE